MTESPMQPLPFDQLVVALQRAGVTLECPACNHGDWRMDEQLLVGLDLVDQARDFEVTGDQAIYIGMTCTNCGYTRFFDPTMLRKHLSKQAAVRD